MRLLEALERGLTMAATIKAFLNALDKAPGAKYKDVILQASYVWSNEACQGYALQALKDAGVDEATRLRVMNELYWAFDRLTVEEAEALASDPG